MAERSNKGNFYLWVILVIIVCIFWQSYNYNISPATVLNVILIVVGSVIFGYFAVKFCWEVNEESKQEEEQKFKTPQRTITLALFLTEKRSGIDFYKDSTNTYFAKLDNGEVVKLNDETSDYVKINGRGSVADYNVSYYFNKNGTLYPVIERKHSENIIGQLTL